MSGDQCPHYTPTTEPRCHGGNLHTRVDVYLIGSGKLSVVHNGAKATAATASGMYKAFRITADCVVGRAATQYFGQTTRSVLGGG